MEKYLMKSKDIPIVKEIFRKKQDNKCLICQRGFEDMLPRDCCLDHNHKTWKVRGLLCRQCNVLESKVHNAFVRTGAKNKGIDFIKFLKGLAKFEKVKDSKWTYPPKVKRKRKVYKKKIKQK